MAQSELHVRGNIFFTSDRMHVYFATALFFLNGNLLLHISNPFSIPGKM